MSVLTAFTGLFRRELSLAWAGGGGAALPAAFFLGMAALGPFALGENLDVAPKAAAAILWLALALATLLALDRMFQADLEEGVLEQLALSANPLEAGALAKILAQWVAVGLPLAGLSPLGALIMGAPPAGTPALALSLAVGSLAFFALGAIGAALAAGLKRAGLLIAILVLPFLAAPLIFGAAAGARALSGQAFAEPLLLVAATALFGLALAPPACAAALRLHLD